MKRAIILISVLLVLVIVAPFVVLSFVDWGEYKTQAQTQIKKLTGHEVALKGDLEIALIPSPRVYIEDVVIKAPAGSKQENLLTLTRLDVHVAFLPLLKGEVTVSSIELVEPNIALEILKDGTPNWLTPELKKKQSGQSSNLASSVSLQGVKIKDGQFSYDTTTIEDINLDVEAKTLQGPFELSGSFVFGGQNVDFEASAGELAPGAGSISLKTEANLKDFGVGVDYAGVVSWGDDFGVQGETAINISSISKVLNNSNLNLKSDKASLKGILTASAQKFEYNNLTIEAAGQKLSGALGASLAPMVVAGKFNGSEIIDLDAFLPSPKNGAKTDLGSLGKALPETISLPVQLDAEFEISFPGAIYKKELYNDVAVGLSKKEKSFKAEISAGGIPGKGKADVNADLIFASKSQSEKTGAEVYSDSRLSLSVKGQSQNIAQTLQAVTGQPAAYAEKFKAGKFNVKALIAPKAVVLERANLNLDGEIYLLSGSLSGQKLQASITAPHIDMLSKPASIKTEFSQDGKVYDLKNATAKISGIDMAGDVRYDGGGVKPDVQGTVRFENLDLNFINTGSKKPSGGAIDSTWMNSVNADLDITAESIKYKNWDLTKPELKLKLNNGTLDIQKLETGLYGGQASLTGEVKSTGAHQPIFIQANPKLTNVDVEQLVKSLAGNAIIKGRGKVNLEAGLSTSGINSDALVAGLKGQGKTTGQSLVLEGFDLTRFAEALSGETKPGDTLMGLWSGASQGGSTAFDTMDGAFAIDRGLVSITKLDLDGPKATVATKGTVNLPKSYIKTAHTITLKERTDVPPFTINIEGPLSNPGQTFAQGAINDYLTRKLNRKLEKLLTDKLGLPGFGSPQPTPQQVEPSGSAQPPPPPSQETSPEEVFKGILEGLIQ